MTRKSAIFPSRARNPINLFILSCLVDLGLRTYRQYAAYSRSAEAEADIEALLSLAQAIKAKRDAEAAAEAAIM